MPSKKVWRHLCFLDTWPVYWGVTDGEIRSIHHTTVPGRYTLHHELPLFQACHCPSQVGLTGFRIDARRIKTGMTQKISDIA